MIFCKGVCRGGGGGGAVSLRGYKERAKVIQFNTIVQKVKFLDFVNCF